jgi:two-component system chemotaxis response regulator CheB
VSPRRRLRAIVVDDSAPSRETLAGILQGGGIEVIARARDGEEALRDVLRLEPDLVLLDLNMPRMDGFTFLRLVMAQRPTPVIVVSSWAGKADAFKSLELGALDFVAKPEPGAEAAAFGAVLLEKCATVRLLRIGNLAAQADVPMVTPVPAARAAIEPPRVAVVGASTGGPRALQRLLAELPHDLPLGVLVAQHMPERFTRAFADRLGRATRFAVAEARDGDLVASGRVLVAPGGSHLEVRRDRGALVASVVVAERGATRAGRYVPSVDRLFSSAARELGARVCGVVLTGMGNDGRVGAERIRAAGGLVLAESEDTAVVYGMPRSAVASGSVDELLGLPQIAARLVTFARGG